MSILRLLVLDSSHCFDDLKLNLRLNVDLKIKDSRLDLMTRMNCLHSIYVFSYNISCKIKTVLGLRIEKTTLPVAIFIVHR